MRARIILEGIVQGVNCRTHVKRIAEHMEIGGAVRNLPAGEVEIYAEFKKSGQITDFIAAIKKEAEGTAIQISGEKLYTENHAEYAQGKIPVDFKSFRIDR